ncbi:MAG: hypothetical protein V3U41_10615 [candidate division NC10 bacterium]
MAKKKKGRRKQGMVSKLINLGGIAIGLSRILEIIFNNISAPADIPKIIIRGASFGLAEGSFNMQEGLRFYAPLAGAVGYRMFTKFLFKRFPIR